MNRGRNGRTIARGRRAAPNAVAMVRRLEHRVSGHRIVPSPHPTTFVERPWNSWTFERTSVTAASSEASTITVGDIITQIRNRCAIAEAGNQILIKVQSAAAWVTAATLVYPDLEAVFYELSSASTSDQAVRSQQRDKGTLNMPAKAGYVYPMSDQKEILGPEDANTFIFSAIADNSGSTITARVRLLWQSST